MYSIVVDASQPEICKSKKQKLIQSYNTFWTICCTLVHLKILVKIQCTLNLKGSCAY